MKRSFDVVPYDIDALKKQLSVLSKAPLHVIESKLHTRYFQKYFARLSAKTIVVEQNYIDRDFLQDFAAYYVFCFREYCRTCARLHFFRNEFDASALEELLEGSNRQISASQLNENYLGFVVVKPLPQTIIGRTCLATYSSEDRRHYPTQSRHKAYLFGIPLDVDTVAFQEQDASVAVCATSALWSIFQCTARLFNHSIPSPVEITKAATEPANMDTRILPNPGLTTVQMAEAVRKLQLEPFLVGAEDLHTVQATAYAYLHAKIPAMLAIRLFGIDSNGTQNFKGLHAVAVTGYSLGKADPEPDPRTGMLLRAARMDKLYAHDDQIGPFAKMEFDQGSIPAFLTTSWSQHWTNYQAVNAAPTCMLFPLYRKIRIPFTTIQDTLIRFDNLIQELRTNHLVHLSNRLEWDVYLTFLNDFKSEIANGSFLSDPALRRTVLCESMPRFLWRATGFEGDRPVLDLLFDATDIEQGSFFVRPIVYDNSLLAVLCSLAQERNFEQAFRDRSAWQIFEWLKAH